MVRDIGTAFEVALEGDGGAGVVVGQGAVEVVLAVTPGDPAIRVDEGQRLRWRADGGRSQVMAARMDEVAAWRHDEILFDAAPVDTALRRLARYRRAPLWLAGDFGDLPPVTATFRREDVEDAVGVLVEQGRLRVMRLPGGALLVRPPVASAAAGPRGVGNGPVADVLHH